MTVNYPEPRQSIMFAGHLVDAPERTPPRFPERMAGAAAQRIAQELEALQAQLDPARAVLSAPQVLGPLGQGEDAYERCNRWLSDTALAHGPARMTLIVLWEGGGGDGPGGTAHMVGHVRQQGGRVIWIDTPTLRWRGRRSCVNPVNGRSPATPSA